MAVKESLADYLRRKKDESEVLRNNINAEKKLDQWQKAIESLYAQIKKWLQEEIEQQIVTVRETKLYITEEYIGEYETKKMILNVGADEVVFEPKGTMVLGASGRVDMMGREGTIMLILPEQEKFNAVGSDWYIAAKETPRRDWPFTKEAFEEALKQVMG